MNLDTYRECAKARQQMQTLLDTSSTASLPQDLEAHLQRCTACREMWRLSLHYEDLLRVGRAQIPDAGDLLTAFHRRLEAEPTAMRKRGFFFGKSSVFREGVGKRRQLLLGLGGAAVATLALLWGATRTLFLPSDRSAPTVQPPVTTGKSGTRIVAKGLQSRTAALLAPSPAHGALKLMKPPIGPKEPASSTMSHENPQLALRIALPKESEAILETPTTALRGSVSYSTIAVARKGVGLEGKKALPQTIVGFSGGLSTGLEGKGAGLKAAQQSKPAASVRIGSFGDRGLLDDSVSVLDDHKHTSPTLMAEGFAASGTMQAPTENAGAAKFTNQSQGLPPEEPDVALGELPIRLHVCDPRRGFTSTLQVVPATSPDDSTPLISLQEAPMPKTEGGQP